MDARPSARLTTRGILDRSFHSSLDPPPELPRRPEMAYAGQTLENPVSGEKITFIQTASDTDGELLEIELELSPDGAVPGEHIHPEQEERFEIVEGKMAFRMG